MSKKDLQDLIDTRVGEATRTAKMSKEEKQIREIVRDESKRSFMEALGEFFSTGDDDDDDGEEAGGNDGGGDGIVTRLAKTFAGESK